VAELQGHLATVATSFNPEEKIITISKPVPQAWIDWLNAPAHAQYLSERDPDNKNKYFYLRLWTGGSGDAEEPDHAFTPGTRAELLGTGLNVTFSKHGLPGDFWIIAARPNTPDLVVPWELMEQAPHAGTRFFFAPLALIDWFVEDPTAVESEVLDCRHKFRPLCDVGEGFKVSTGLVIFEGVQAGERRFSPLISHGLGVNYVAIVMAQEVVGLGGRPMVIMGDRIEEGPSFSPELTAHYEPDDPNMQFLIFLHDRRPVAGEPQPLNWQIRWWAIPKTLDRPDVTVPPPAPGVARFPGEFLLALLIMRPGITVRELASDLKVEPSVIQPELDRLREAGRIRVDGERLFLVSRVTPSPRPGLTERIIEFIRNNPRSTLSRLTRGLGVDLAVLKLEVSRLVVEGLIRRDPRGRFTLSEPK
jgi:hypothetical protein